ncbi:high osmolarity signaling protein SHO1 [Scheffersomyces xylosifermentans]|uniref:high osmolarity signaling protein SHO1 n=1 Tax=Scheffersomyces xylosifermentans TaxID=1304137 RepID=UPI00315D7715
MPFALSNFTGDPFAISTISYGVISWVVAIAGAASSDQSAFPHFSWWGIVYQILIIIVVFLLYLNNNIELYKFTLVGLVSVAFIYTTNSTNQLIYHSDSSGNLCCAAGCILLSILNLIWILYFGGHPESPTNQFIDSFSLKTHTHNHGHISSTRGGNKLEEDDEEDEEYRRYVNPPRTQSTNFQENNVRQSQLTTNNNSTTANNTTNNKYMASSQLNGLENFSSSDVRQSRDLTNNNAANKRNTVYNDATSQTNIGITFRYRAKALYSYDANPDDINEISFIKDEVMEVDDIDGKWWQARRSNGQVGICPSNYVKLLD